MNSVTIVMVPPYKKYLIHPLVYKKIPLEKNRNMSVPLNRLSILQKYCIQ